MDSYVNEILGLKEEGMPIKESTIITNNTPSHKTTGEGHLEDKGEETDNNITLQMPLLPWIMSPYQWIYPEVMHQPIGRDEVVKEDGIKEDTKEE